ncbi:MAG TPA: peptidylprolyl isomerase [Candidatus Nanoarchaeia archaeon]|nr:peptidylprolyl isomerase [Candidatus Nanoarchaeia archaeon]
MKVQKGNHIKVSYEGRFDDGTVFDSSKHDDHDHPLEFEVGAGQVINGFDMAVMDMQEGEEKEFSIEAKDAYGLRDPALEKDIPRESLPADQEPKADMMLMMRTPDGKQIPLRIARVGKDTITLDLNHPLAGKRLTFKIKIVEIAKP